MRRRVWRGPLGRGIIGGRQSQPRYRWYAPAWGVDGSGYAYANPALGPELFANGSFDTDANWTKGAGWTIAGGVAVGSTASGRLSQNVGDAGAVYRVAYDIVTRSAGSLRAFVGQAAGDNMTAPGSYISVQAQGATDELGVTPTSFSGTVDNLSAKEVTGTTYAYVRASSVRQIGVRMVSLPPGNVAVSLRGFVPSPTSLDGVLVSTSSGSGAPFRLGLTKVVAGVTTTLIAVTTASFVSNALIELRRTAPTTYQMWYNGSQVGTDQTISDSQFASSPPCFGLTARDAVCRFSEFQINGVKVPFRF